MNPLALILAAAALTVPALPKTPLVDGDLKDLSPAVSLKPSEGQTFTAKVAYRKDTLFVGVEVRDPAAEKAPLSVSLHFPGAGTTAGGRVFTFTLDGLKPAEGDAAARYAEQQLRSKVKATKTGFAVELAIPPEALPRWPATEPMDLELCVEYRDASNCESGSMPSPIHLPEEYRKSFKVKFPEKLEGIERVENGWVGYSMLHFPVWVEADEPLTEQSVKSLVTDHPIGAAEARIPLPQHLLTPDGRTLAPVITGKDPYGVEDQCDGSHELRLALYVIDGRTARRVLEWPVANCALGCAASITLDPNGELTIGYSNGGSATFTWSQDHFEQTQLG